MIKVWAHRGASAYAPENTLEAFKLAMDMGADGVELDVHMSADGEVVVAHDEDAARVTGVSGQINDMTLAELRELDFGSLFEKYRGAKIPTLKEVHELLAGSGMTVNVELKTNVYEYPGIEEKCVSIAEECGVTANVIYSSFNHESLGRIKAINPGLPIGLLDGTARPADYAIARRADAIHPGHRSVTARVCEEHKAAGIRIHPWTVDDPEEMARLAALGVDAIITNVPDVAIKALR